MNWFITVLTKRYAQFTGRARRAEFWYFTLFYLLIYVGLAIVDALTGMLRMESGLGLLSGIFALAALIPSIAVAVRRLHDTNRSGWWVLMGFVPLIGLIVLLVFYFQEGTAGDNQYGPNPKG